MESTTPPSGRRSTAARLRRVIELMQEFLGRYPDHPLASRVREAPPSSPPVSE